MGTDFFTVDALTLKGLPNGKVRTLQLHARSPNFECLCGALGMIDEEENINLD